MGLFQMPKPRGFHHVYIYGKEPVEKETFGNSETRYVFQFRSRKKRLSGTAQKRSLLLPFLILFFLVGVLYYLITGNRIL